MPLAVLLFTDLLLEQEVGKQDEKSRKADIKDHPQPAYPDAKKRNDE